MGVVYVFIDMVGGVVEGCDYGGVYVYELVVVGIVCFR